MPASRKRPRDIPRAWLFLVFLIISGLLWGLVQVFRAQDLSDLVAETSPDTPAAPVRDLKAVFSQSISGSYPLRLTEAELNGYFAQTLVAEQKGWLAGLVTLEKVLVRLENERAELIMVRRAAGLTLTSSIFLKLEQTESREGALGTHVDIDGGPMPVLSCVRQGGRFGRLLLPQGFMLFVRPGYIRLAEAFPDEIRLGIEEMARIKIEDGVLELDPRFDSGMADF